MFSYATARRTIWETNRRDSQREAYLGFVDFRSQPYTAAKVVLYSEIAAVLLFLAQFTGVSPNFVSMVFAGTGIVGAVLLASGNDAAVIAGLVCFFLKSLFDFVDGNLARLTNRRSDEGAILDEWGAIVNAFGFLIGLGFYLFDRTGDFVHIYLLVTMLLLRGIDMRHFTYVYTVVTMLEGRPRKAGAGASTPAAVTAGSWTNRLRYVLANTLDDRARTVDLICLVVLVEVITGRVWASPFIYWAYLAKHVLTFGFGWYMLYVKKLPSEINAIVFEGRP